MMSKPKVGFYWCASCGGCEEAIVDLAADILGVVAAVDIVFWPCAMDFKREDVEAMADGEMAVCFMNGAIRTSEQLEMAELLRRKAGLLIAFGSCAHTGGIPGLANLYSREGVLATAYNTAFSTVNPEGMRPQTSYAAPEGTVTLPELHETVKALDQVVPVDYYLPGCPPPVKLITGALGAILEGKLPPKGSILAPEMALCHECPRKDTKPDKLTFTEFKRPHQIIADPEKCLLAQGLLCLGPDTRAGCEAPCIKGNMPCTGCGGPLAHTKDFGANALSATASVLDATDEATIAAGLAEVADPAGTFYRYSLPASLLYAKKGN
jgi:F420-non-reducing hydrogenase small subunit